MSEPSLKGSRVEVATWLTQEPHGPPVVELRTKAGKGLVGRSLLMTLLQKQMECLGNRKIQEKKKHS